MTTKADRVATATESYGAVVGRLEGLLAEVEECHLYTVSNQPEIYLDDCGEITEGAVRELRNAKNALMAAICEQMMATEETA